MFRKVIVQSKVNNISLQRTRYLNAANTFQELLSMGVVPIVNENDTVSVSVSRGMFENIDTGNTDNNPFAGNQIW
jgi:glutamate 5-kinase